LKGDHVLNKKPVTPTNLEEIIENLESAVLAADEETETYTKMVGNLETLYKLRDGHKPSKIELKDLLPVLGSVGGILIIVLFEAFGHTLTSKSVGFVTKLKS
jgi:hypothetical protein